MEKEKLNESIFELATGTAGIALVNVEALSIHGKIRPVMKAAGCITLACDNLEYTIHTSLEEGQKAWREAQGFATTGEVLNRILIRGIKWMEVVAR